MSYYLSTVSEKKYNMKVRAGTGKQTSNIYMYVYSVKHCPI